MYISSTPATAIALRVAPANLGPAIQYYLPANTPGAVTIEFADAKGSVVNSYAIEPATSTGREGRPGPGMPGSGGVTGDPDDPDAPSSRRGGAPPPRVTKLPGLNRVVWDLRNKDGVVVPPGQYQARLRVSDKSFTKTFNVLIDPRVAADGVTVADLQEQYEHNMRMRALVNDMNQLVARVREAQRNLNAAAGNGESTAP